MENSMVENDWIELNIKCAYRKAHIKRAGSVLLLKSYETIVASYNFKTGELKRHWSGYSATTMRHVKMFVCYIKDIPYNNRQSFGKKNWDALPVEPLEC